MKVFLDTNVIIDYLAGFDIPVMTPNEFIARCKE